MDFFHVPKPSAIQQMTINDDRIVRIAQKFFDSITFSLNEPLKPLETEIEEERPLEDDSTNLSLNNLFNLCLEEAALKKKRKGWNVGEILPGNELTNFHGKRFIFSNEKVKLIAKVAVFIISFLGTSNDVLFFYSFSSRLR